MGKHTELIILLSCFALLIQSDVLPLPENSVEHSRVSQDKWVFYSFTVPAGKSFSLTVEHGLGASRDHDIDVYVRKAVLPDRNNFDYKDTSFVTTILINGHIEAAATYYIAGVYGFKGDSTPFSILLKFTSGCIDDCNSHGTCRNSVCTCSAGYAGESCNVAVSAVTLNRDNPAAVSAGNWLYYSVEVYSANNLMVHVTQTSGDADLYIKYQKLPTFVDFNYADYSRGSAPYNISITQPNLGTWYLAFYGYETTSFSFVVSEARACPMRCSLHGACIGSFCRCNTGYTGLTCEEARDALAFDKPVTGYVDANYWNFYKFNVDSNNPVDLVLTHEAGTNCDIYVLDNAKPTQFVYYYRNISESLTTDVVVPTPGFRTWWVGIYGFTQCSYTLTMKQIAPPANPCGECTHGRCVGTACLCDGGWIGKDCNVQTTALTNSIKTSPTEIINGEWKYYSIFIPNTSKLTLVLTELNTQGLAWMYVAKETYPTLSSYEVEDSDSRSSIHRLVLEFKNTQNKQYVIGVYGSPFIVQQHVQFTLVAHYTPF
eukprot:TRINITY_DN7252_c0_g3_i1.p1 TRINITY_DN7252_c0_g3~~TRINITY_DN7252_c0_g3_i1.p1  ORF type:complete len:543 (-),score=89.64 TRINITY_DN7252_c0_g3_i1:43-1671(-)